jgi:hypothetical protein
MKPGDLVQHRNNPEFIYVVLGEEVDPEDGMMNIVLLDLEGGTREWCADQIRKVYKVISETR